MLKILRKCLIGGDSGARELIICLWIAWGWAFRDAMLQEAAGAVMGGTFGVLTVAVGALVGLTGAAYGLLKLTDNGYFEQDPPPVFTRAQMQEYD